jgi:hypothetical protein
MMRPRLIQTLSEPRTPRGGGVPRRRRGEKGVASSATSPSPSHMRVAPAATPCDPAVARVREAGGPIDRAAYTCECGYLFSAPVSTTVHCPHCGVGQAW